MILLSVDPGAHYAGWAMFEGDDLFACGIQRELLSAVVTPTRVGRAGVSCCGSVADQIALLDTTLAPLSILCELPSTKDKRAKKAASSDLTLLAAMCGAFAGRWPRSRCAFVEPSEWKGQTPKGVMHNRILGKLRENERECLARAQLSKTDQSHVVDAIGIGLWGLWRL